MTSDLLYLPVSDEERTLLRWLRTSPFAADLPSLRAALSEAATRGLDSGALTRLIAAGTAANTPRPAGATPAAEWQALQQSVDAESARWATRLADIDARLRLLESRAAPPGKTTPPAAPSAAPSDPKEDLKPDSRIGVVINGRLVQGATVPSYLKALASMLIDNEWLVGSHLPLSSGRMRYFASSEPVHPSGKAFVRAIEHRGFFFEVNHGVQSIAAITEKVAADLGLTSEVIHLELRGRDHTPSS